MPPPHEASQMIEPTPSLNEDSHQKMSSHVPPSEENTNAIKNDTDTAQQVMTSSADTAQQVMTSSTDTAQQVMTSSSTYTKDDDSASESTSHDRNIAIAEQSFNDERLSLDSLPPEIFMKICSYLHAKIVITILGQVCRSFHELLSSDSTWKIRIAKQWPKKYPPVDILDFNWKRACIEREEQYRQWNKADENMEHFTIRSNLFASIDSVHLMKKGKYLASGSRDRYLNIWNLDKCNSEPEVSILNAHKGWIWSISSLEDRLCTGSWDKHIKLWDLNYNCMELSKFLCSSAVLDTHYEPNMIIASSYDKKVYRIDPRVGITSEKKYHKMPVLCQIVDGNYVITGSEDKTIVIYDRIAEKVFKTLKMESFPLSMSYGLGQLWVGLKHGFISLIDTTTTGDFNIVDTYDVGHTGKVTGIKHTLGSVITCSMDKTIKVLEPNVDPGIITTLTSHSMEIAGIDLQNGVLASAGSDVCIGIWRPKEPTDV